MAEGFSNASKAAAARAVIGTDGLQIRIASGDPGANGTSNILSTSTGGYAHLNIDNGNIAISTAGVITFPSAAVSFPDPTGEWSAVPSWAAVFTRASTPVFVGNVDITDIAKPGSNNTVQIPADGFSLTPMP